MSLKTVGQRLKSLFVRNTLEQDMDREMRLHLDLLTEEYERSGMIPDEAQRAARRRFGDMRRLKERGTDIRGLAMLDALLGDIRHAARSLIRNPALTVAVALTLALAIGANTTIFSMVYGVLLRPLPYPEPDRLVRISSVDEERSRDNHSSIPDYLDWKQRATSFEAMEAFLGSTPVYIDGDRKRTVLLMRATPGFLDLAGAQPVLGRRFQPDDFEIDAPRVVVLTRELWLNQFGGDPGVIGQSVRLGESRGRFSDGIIAYDMDVNVYTVIGVAASIDGPLGASAQAIVPWIIETDTRRDSRTHWFVSIVARLRPGVSLVDAQAELESIGRGVREQHPEDPPMMPAAVSLYEGTVASVRPALIVLLGATGLILLIAVSNIANLLLARGTARQNELAVRAALGAGKLRLARLLLTESLLLSLLGGVAGILLGFGGIRVLLSMEPTWIPRLPEIAIDGTVLGVSLAVTIVSGLIFGLAPVLLVRGSLMRSARQASGGSENGRRWLRSALIVSQIALSLVLLTGAGLMIRSFLALHSVPIGIDYRQIVTFSLDGGGFLIAPSGPNRIAELQRFRNAMEYVRSIPGVRSTTLTSQPPLKASGGSAGMQLLTGASAGQQRSAGLIGVTEDFFEFFGSRVVAGRLFEAADGSRGEGVVVVDADLAEILWPGEPAVGQRVAFYGTNSQVIGVVQPIRYGELTAESSPRMYHLLDRPGGGMFGGTALVRHDGDAEPIMAAIQARLKEFDGAMQVTNLQPLAAVYDQWLREPRFYLVLLGGLGALGFVVAVLGVYGVVAYSVSRRTSEIGIRIALGAQRLQIVGLFCRRTVLLIAAGLMTGVLGSLWLSRYIQTLLFQVEPTDPLAFASTAILLAAAALIATLIPTRRALRIDPATTLRAE